MPIIDYRCPNGHVETTVLPVSKCGNDHPESEVSRCPVCRRKSHRVYDYNGALSSTTAIGFTDKSGTSMVMHLNTSTGEYSIPGHRDDPLPGRNYKRVSINSIKQYEKVRRAIETKELEKAHIKQAIEREYFDSTSRLKREDTRQKMELAISKGGHYVQHTDEKGITRTRWAPITPRARALFDLACANSDRRREEIRRARQSGTPNFHSRLIEYRESERSIVDGTAKRPVMPDIQSLLKRYGNGRP